MSKKEDERAERKAKKKLQEGKSAKTAAGEFVHEEMKHYEQGKHGRSRKQAVAIGISKPRRHGVPYPQKGSQGRPSENSAGDRYKGSLYKQAQKMGIRGRSKMNKKELARAIQKAG
jgi:Family of unknown function (DUF6496)/Rho termination factor, N-terminal domain